ncbi:MAG: MarR family transcriptional regulator [Kineosporiaceae bacterium]|nr:MarR family transcriptional regulator [Kineosporiaceae bacterium]
MAGARARPLPFDPVAEARGHWERAGWAEAAPGMAAVTSIMRAQQVLLARIEEVLRPHGLSFARYEVLMLLSFSRTGALPLARLGERLQVHPASVTNLVDRLTAAGLVSRVAHPSDRRATLAELTEAGRSLALAATADLNATVFAAPGLTPDGVQRLVEVLTELRRDAGDFTP